MSPRRLSTVVATLVVALIAVALVRAPRASAAGAPLSTALPASDVASASVPAPIVVKGRLHLRSQPLTPGTQAIVQGDGDCLRLRSGPSLSASVITCLPDQSSVMVMPSTQVAGDYRWQLVTAGKTVGWVADQFLDAAPSATGCAAPGAQRAAFRPGFSSQLPSSGIGAAVWGGGTTDGVITAALAQGCSPMSIWAQESGSGKLIGYLTHVPAWVNKSWEQQFTGSNVPAGTILFIVCSDKPATSATVPLILAPATAPTRKSSAEPPATKATAAVIIDAASGEVLYGDHEHEQLAPASLTKMATAVVAIEGSEPSQWVVNNVDSRTLVSDGDSVMGLLPGDCFRMNDLLYGLLLPSGNDAALAIAQYIGGSTPSFVHEMNTFAHRLGLENTSFTDPDGLGGPNHYSSAYDLAMIARYGMTLPAFRQVVDTKTWTAHGTRSIPLYTLNQFLLNYPGADGLKTGWTPQAGPTLAVSAERNGHRLIAVVLNDQTRYTDVTNLMDWAFSTFRWP